MKGVQQRIMTQEKIEHELEYLYERPSTSAGSRSPLVAGLEAPSPHHDADDVTVLARAGWGFARGSRRFRSCARTGKTKFWRADQEEKLLHWVELVR